MTDAFQTLASACGMPVKFAGWEVRIPQLVPPSPNSCRREHPMAGHRRVKKERAAVALVLSSHRRVAPPVVVTLTRCSPGTLDKHDNLPASLKSVADEVARFLGLDDRDPRIEWRYAQRRVERKRQGVVVRVEASK